MKSIQVTAGLRLLSGMSVLVCWQALTVIVGNDLLPGPAQVFIRIWDELQEGSMISQLAITLRRVLISFLIAMLAGTAIGIVMGSRERLNILLDGLLILGLNIPALVVIILCYIWFGLTEVAAVAAVALNKIPMVIVTLREGARAVDKDLMAVAKVYRVPGPETFAKIYVPQLYSFLLVAARNGLALIWKIVLVVELLGRSDGVGFQLGTFFQFFDVEGILAYTFAFIFVIFLIEAAILRPLDRRLVKWR